jgi:hypothetical protein
MGGVFISTNSNGKMEAIVVNDGHGRIGITTTPTIPPLPSSITTSVPHEHEQHHREALEKILRRKKGQDRTMMSEFDSVEYTATLMRKRKRELEAVKNAAKKENEKKPAADEEAAAAGRVFSAVQKLNGRILPPTTPQQFQQQQQQKQTGNGVVGNGRCKCQCNGNNNGGTSDENSQTTTTLSTSAPSSRVTESSSSTTSASECGKEASSEGNNNKNSAAAAKVPPEKLTFECQRGKTPLNITHRFFGEHFAPFIINDCVRALIVAGYVGYIVLVSLVGENGFNV